MRKTNIFLVILLVIQIGLIAFQYKPGDIDSSAVVALLPEIPGKQITRLTVEDEEEKKVILFQDKRDSWKVAGPEKISYPADQEKVRDIINRLTKLKSKRLVTKTASSHVRLKVDEQIFAKKITLDSDNGEPYILYLGSQVGGKTLHARNQNSDKAYLVSGISSWELGTEPDSWWQKDYLETKESEVSRIALSNKKGSFSLNKKGENWQLSDEDTLPAKEKISDLLKLIDNLTVKDYLSGKDKSALDNPEAVLKIDSPDNKLILKISPLEDEENVYIVKSSQSPYFVTMRSYILRPLLEKEKRDFLPKEVVE